MSEVPLAASTLTKLVVSTRPRSITLVVGWMMPPLRAGIFRDDLPPNLSKQIFKKLSDGSPKYPHRAHHVSLEDGSETVFSSLA
jgi:hypothetical protein